MSASYTEQDLRSFADAMRDACVEEAVAAYEYGGLSGLCVEGRWDLAMDRLRSLDTGQVLSDWLAAAAGRRGNE